jgi:hypothetical protein
MDERRTTELENSSFVCGTLGGGTPAGDTNKCKNALFRPNDLEQLLNTSDDVQAVFELGWRCLRVLASVPLLSIGA